MPRGCSARARWHRPPGSRCPSIAAIRSTSSRCRDSGGAVAHGSPRPAETALASPIVKMRRASRTWRGRHHILHAADAAQPASTGGPLRLVHNDNESMELRRRLAALTEEARRNEDAWQRAHQREMSLLEAGSLAELLERLTDGLRASYRLAAA